MIKVFTKKQREESKNYKLMNEFALYCLDNPDQRFWQALRNWSGEKFILTSKELLLPYSIDSKESFYVDIRDTLPDTTLLKSFILAQQLAVLEALENSLPELTIGVSDEVRDPDEINVNNGFIIGYRKALSEVKKLIHSGCIIVF